jgi:hypothetical protein
MAGGPVARTRTKENGLFPYSKTGGEMTVNDQSVAHFGAIAQNV